MDNLCHTLVGVSLARAGLARGSRYATAALVIGANFPDIDVVAVPLGHGIGWRRGVTHGILALFVLPFVLTGLILLWHRWRRRKGDTAEDPAPRTLVLLSFLAILTHPTLDFMNVYGVRWLEPFSGRWFYGDALFIVDPWLWIILLVGVLAPSLSRGRVTHPTRSARVALVAAAAYVSLMMLAAARARHRISGELITSTSLGAPSALMVAPVFANPIRREIVFEDGDHYRFATGAVVGAPLTLGGMLGKGDLDPDVVRAAALPRGREFLHWARFPFFRVDRSAAATLVHIADARYSRDATGSWASVTIRLPARVAPASGAIPPAR